MLILQNVVLNAQLQTRRQMIQMTYLDKLQFEASLHYGQTHQATFRVDNQLIKVNENQLIIRLGETTYTRDLLQPAP